MTLASVVVVVDGAQLDGVPMGSLADFVAMVALSDYEAEDGYPGVPTILNLFALRPSFSGATPELSGWDRSFLRGLYRSEQKYRLQRAQIANHMLESVKH